MRDPCRIGPIIHIIEKIWRCYPQMRLGQILSSVAQCIEWCDNDMFYIEDDELYEGLKLFLKYKKEKENE